MNAGFPWYIWAIVVLVLLFLFAVEVGYRLNQQLMRQSTTDRERIISLLTRRLDEHHNSTPGYRVLGEEGPQYLVQAGLGHRKWLWICCSYPPEKQPLADQVYKSIEARRLFELGIAILRLGVS